MSFIQNCYNEKFFTILLEISIILTISGLIIILKNKILNRMLNQSSKRFGNQLEIIAYAAKRPLTMFIMLMTITFIARLIEGKFESQALFDWVSPFRKVGMSIILVWFSSRLIHKVEKQFLSHYYTNLQIDNTSILAAGKLLRVVVHIAGALVILPALGIPISGVLALGGVGGIAVGFAAKDMVANFLGGAVLYAERPFSVGDLIESTDKDIKGTVISIGWRTTKIRRPDRQLMFVPNSMFSAITLINVTKRTHARIQETLSIRYEDIKALPHIVQDLKTMLQQHPDIDQYDIIHVGISELSSSAVECLVWCFTRRKTKVEYLAVLEDVLLKSMKVVEKHGAEMAYPTSTIHLHRAELGLAPPPQAE